MKRHRLAWFLPALLIVALSIEKGEVARAQERFVPNVGRVPASLLEVRNEFILRAPADRVAAIAARRGLTVIRPLDEHAHDVFLVSGPSFLGSRIREADAPALQQLLAEVQGDPDVTQFEVNAVVLTPEVASGIELNGSTVSILDALSDRTIVDYFGDEVWNGYVNQAATSAIRLSASHGAGATGAGILAIIDTGVDPHHPLLAGSLVPGYDFIHDVAGEASEWTDLDGSLVSILDGSTVSILDQQSVVSLNGSTVAILDQDAADALNPTQLPAAFGHGTMVAGLVHLVAPTAKIMPLRAFKADGTSTVFDVVRAIHYAVDNGARVINMSFSATAASPVIAHAVNVATSRGVICVASVGNLGQEVLVYPGALRNVLGIGSTTTADPPTRSSFSNYGAALVSLGAPGEGVITTYPGGGYAGVWGTSFSTPLTAGAAALLLQVDPTLDQAKADSLLGKADRMQADMGKGRLNLDKAVRTLPDATPPTVTMITPSGGVLFGSVVVSASASDNVGVAGVKFLLDDSPLGGEDTVAPYELTWTTATASNGTHVLTAVARDTAGNQSSSIVSVSLSNDTTAPTVTLTSPAAGATVGGTVTVRATASDDLEVFGVQFKLDGAPLGAEDTVPPYELTWTTVTAVNGAHTVTAVARDAAGHETTASAGVMVANDTTPPAISTISSTGATTGATINWTTNEASDSQVDYGPTTAYGSASPLNASQVMAHVVALGGLAANTTYHYRVRSRDAAGNLATSGDFTFTTLAVATSSLTVTPTAVSPGGTVTVMAANGPGNARDWVALHPTTAPDAGYLDWQYLNGLRTPPASGVTGATLTFTMPTTAGTYHMRFFLNNTLARLATSAAITVGVAVTN